MNIYIISLLLAIIWSGYFISTKYAVLELGFISVGLGAYIVAMILMGLLIIKRGLLLLIPGYVKRFPYLLLVGIISIMLNTLFLFGLVYSGAINASILMRFDILFTLLIGYLFFRYTLSLIDYFGIGGMLVSIILIMFHEFQS
ncbi:MAG TPA: EamA family transporter [bacterium]|nr:EamA family transporter [bacterium]